MNVRFLICLLSLLSSLSGISEAQIRANEAIQITISGVPVEEQQQVNNTYPVSAGGTINLPHIGVISAAGMSPMSLAKRIEAAYKAAEIYTTPAVNVIANADARLREKKIHVGGYVRRPGPVMFTEGMTVWQALQAAGGETEFGAVNRLELFSASGKRRVLDLKQDTNKHIRVRENDSINIPQKNWMGR
jgi:protein involved in polysaccharide export with SLBB domain